MQVARFSVSLPPALPGPTHWRRLTTQKGPAAEQFRLNISRQRCRAAPAPLRFRCQLRPFPYFATVCTLLTHSFSKTPASSRVRNSEPADHILYGTITIFRAFTGNSSPIGHECGEY